MDMSTLPWLSEELEMQDQGFMNQCQIIKPYHQFRFSVDTFSSESKAKDTYLLDQAFQMSPCVKVTNNIKKLPRKPVSIDKKLTPVVEKHKPDPNPLQDIPNTNFTISFGGRKPEDEIISVIDSFGNPAGTKKVPSVIRNRIQLQDHMLAERKRREKLAQRFISLSALLPDLKKMDKATVLEDAANYIQELQSRIKELERLSDLKTHDTRLPTSVKRSKHSHNEDDSSSNYDEVSFGERYSACNPEIEVSMSGSSVLVKIYSQKNYLSIIKAISELQRLGLSITSSSSLPFSNTNLLVTIVAKKKDDFLMTPNDLVKNLQLAI